MIWRYQPVWIEDGAGKCFTVVEVHLAKDGTLESWTEGDSLPMGETVEELSGDLTHMMMDALCWEPVPRNLLRPGMRFEKRVSMADRRAMADFIDETKAMVRRQPKPKTN